MPKPKAIEWLEEQTGERIDVGSERVPQDRHLSVRLPDDLAAGLDEWAAAHGVSMSHLVRDLLAEAVRGRREVADLDARRLVDRLQADVAEVSRRLAG
jgi:plasmid stability protein